MIIQGDARSLPLRNGEVALVVTSPPYFGIRTYSDSDDEIGGESEVADYTDALLQATSEMARVLKDDGSIFVNLGDRTSQQSKHRNIGLSVYEDGPRHDGRKHSFGEIPTRSLAGIPWRYANRVVDELGLLLRAEIIWVKPDPVPDFSTTKRVRRAHEQIFHFTKIDKSYADPEPIEGDWRVNGTSTWSIAIGAGYKKHPAVMPPKIVSRIVSHWSRPDDLVLDPFAGSGTTAIVSKLLGRQAVGVDLSSEFVEIARNRLTDGTDIDRVKNMLGSDSGRMF